MVALLPPVLLLYVERFVRGVSIELEPFPLKLCFFPPCLGGLTLGNDEILKGIVGHRRILAIRSVFCLVPITRFLFHRILKSSRLLERLGRRV